jgi:hypothetical protein
MWSAAYGLIALAVVAFVVLYAAAHAPNFKTVNLADQLYNAKRQLANDLPSFLRTTSSSDFASNINVVRVKVANITVSGTTFPVQFPISYKLSARGDNLLYQVYLNVISCRPASLQGGAAVTLYVVELRHSLSQLPWLEVYAAVPRNVTEYYGVLYNLYRRPTVGLDPRVGADADIGLVNYVKAEWALLYDAASDMTILYAAAPPSAPYILVVDYPLAIPLACPPRS